MADYGGGIQVFLVALQFVTFLGDIHNSKRWYEYAVYLYSIITYNYDSYLPFTTPSIVSLAWGLEVIELL